MQPAALKCDDSIKPQFAPDANTQVLLVKEFKQGDSIALSNTPATPEPPKAPADLCLVKLLVGPGNPGPAGAPSTSAGIGIEVWLPTAANWNERIRAYGSGGWAGSSQAGITRIGGGDGNDLHVAAAGKGYVVATSDHGHVAVPGQPPSLSGSFAMNPDGTINTVLWKDFAERSLHELADKTKALAKLYYGKPHKYAYWDGFSTGGRQGLKLAQVYPSDFDGILSGAPAINWTRFITNELYPQVVMKQDLAAAMPLAKLNAVTAASVAACGGGTLGFLTDPFSCHYDPTKDAAALCSGVAGNGGVTGTKTDATSCVNLAEATAINKIWYGQTADGSVPDPATDNASGPYLNGNKQLWFGLTRGTYLGLLAGDAVSPPFFGPFPIATDQVALELQDPTYATTSFINATGNGANKWTTLDYSALTIAAYQGLVLQPQFSNINTDNPDLTAFNNRKGKLLLYHGLSDNLIAPQGSINYYNRVTTTMGRHGRHPTVLPVLRDPRSQPQWASGRRRQGSRATDSAWTG
ncbi:tannase/feruloyl esterase family alpha/beta hydrolase [Polaromonas sp. P2-4]|nr:tannase/feruloyl esterase family alpha/beta hydrolase [Polaromonas sp. P2-4]